MKSFIFFFLHLQIFLSNASCPSSCTCDGTLVITSISCRGNGDGGASIIQNVIDSGRL